MGIDASTARASAGSGSVALRDHGRGGVSSGHGFVVRRERFDEQLFRAAARTPGVTAFEGTLYDPARFPARWVSAPTA